MTHDPVQLLIERLTQLASTSDGSATARLSQTIVRQEAVRLMHRLDAVVSGAFVTRDAMDIAALVESVGQSGNGVPCVLTVSDRLLHELTDTVRGEALSLLLGLLDSDEMPIQGEVRVTTSSILSPVQDQRLLRVLARAVTRGLSVGLVVPEDGPRAALSLEISDNPGRLLVRALLTDGPGGAAWVVELSSSGESPAAAKVEPDSTATRPVIRFSIERPSSHNGHRSQRDQADELTDTASISDLFGSLICLRDLEPRSSDVRGLSELRKALDLPAPFIPRKNDPEYARVVASFALDVAGPDSQVIYVGDTLFNDGSAICNLDAHAPGSVYGFLCNERGFGVSDDIVVGPVYLANRWRSLDRFLANSRRRGLVLAEHAVAFFDLDQTVYAAKGRDDEPLRRARWKALLAYLGDSIPPHRFDPANVERIYRHLDQDAYHRITRDNMDYVALFVLAVAAGLCDTPELEEFAASNDNSIASLTEWLYQRARSRLGHEDIDGVMKEIRRVYFNALAGDQTPCKEYRRYECLATAAAMRGLDSLEPGERIRLNREVVDLVRLLRNRGVHVFALSDRPVEAAVNEDDDERVEDLMSIPMTQTGTSTSAALEEVVR